MLLKYQLEEAKNLVNERKDFIRRLELERREASLNGVVHRVLKFFYRVLFHY